MSPATSLRSRRNEPLVRFRGIVVTERLADRLAELTKRAAHIGARISWTSGLRSHRQQNELFERWEAGDPNVPFEPLPYARSMHSWGRAADGEVRPSGLASTVGRLALRIGLRWTAREPWHFEVR